MNSSPVPLSQRQPDWNATWYDDKAAFVSVLGGDALLPLMALKPGEWVLDVGCGTGTLAARMVDAGGVVVGVDAAEDMIERARAAVPRARFFVADAQQLWSAPSIGSDGAAAQGIERGRFDAILSNAALHWMPRMSDAARSMAEALRPGGRLVAEFGGADCVRRVRQSLAEALRARRIDPTMWQPWTFPDLATYAQVLKVAGLRPRLMHEFARPTRLPGDAALRDWLRTFAAPVLNALGPQADAVLSETEDRCRPHLWRDDAWILDYVRLRVVADKPLIAEGAAISSDAHAFEHEGR